MKAGILTPKDIEQRAKERQMTMEAVCEAAGVDRSTFTRAKRDGEFKKLSTMRKLASVLGEAAA